MPACTRTGRTGIVIAAIFPARELLATSLETPSRAVNYAAIAPAAKVADLKLPIFYYEKALTSAGCASLARESSRTCCK